MLQLLSEILVFLLKSPSIPHFNPPSHHVLQLCLKVVAPAVGEKKQRNICMEDSAKMLCPGESPLQNWATASETHLLFECFQKEPFLKGRVPELPTILPWKRFPRLLVAMMLGMFSKTFFAYNCVSTFLLNLHALNTFAVLYLGFYKALEAASSHCTKCSKKQESIHSHT